MPCFTLPYSLDIASLARDYASGARKASGRAGKHADNRVLMILLAPGLWLQRLTTREPELDQLEVSIRALREVLDREGALTPADRRVEVMA